MKLPSEMSLAQIAQMIGGQVQGPADLKVSSFAQSPLSATTGDIALVTDRKLLKRLGELKASALIVPEGTVCDLPVIFVKRPMLAIQKILSALKPKRFIPSGIHPSAVIDPSAEIGEKVSIGPFVAIGPHTKVGARTVIMAGTVVGGAVEIGDDCLFHPGCLIADYVKIGNRVILQQGASLGADGFGYVTERPSNMELRQEGIKELSDEPNPLLKIPQIGTVILEDDVEIGSNSTIDRATVGATVIGAGTKIDNLVMIAHNCRLGRETIIVAQAGIAGSCTIGERVIIAGHAGIKDHIKIGKDAIIEGQAGVLRDVGEGEVVVGAPAMPMREFFTRLALWKKLPKFNDDIKSLQKKVAQLEEELLQKQRSKNGGG